MRKETISERAARRYRERYEKAGSRRGGEKCGRRLPRYIPGGYFFEGEAAGRRAERRNEAAGLSSLLFSPLDGEEEEDPVFFCGYCEHETEITIKEAENVIKAEAVSFLCPGCDNSVFLLSESIYNKWD